MVDSYDEIYEEDVSTNLGSMLEYAVRLGYDPALFWGLFAASEAAEQIEKGNPRYLAGYSGRDYLRLVIKKPAKEEEKLLNAETVLSFGKPYWAGSIMAILQRRTGLSFLKIERKLPLRQVLQMYEPLHEADPSKFYDLALERLINAKEETNLKKIRVAGGLSQSQLAEASRVDIRSIQMYEQRKNDINKSQAGTLYKLAKALSCPLEALLEKERLS